MIDLYTFLILAGIITLVCYTDGTMKDYSMRPKRQVPTKTTDIRQFVSITPATDDQGGYVVMQRYEGKERQGKAAVMHCDGSILPERARQLVEEFRNTKQ